MERTVRWSRSYRPRAQKYSCACAAGRRREDAFSLLLSRFDDCADRFDNMFVAGAAAEIARQAFADVIVRGERIFAQEISRGHQHAWGAKAALQGMMRVKRFLQLVHLPDATEALDRFDSAAIGLHRKHQTGTRAVAVYQDRTGATDAVLTTHMGAGEA